MSVTMLAIVNRKRDVALWNGRSRHPRSRAAPRERQNSMPWRLKVNPPPFFSSFFFINGHTAI